MSLIQIDSERYRELLLAEAKLDALEAGGVDGWDWYDESLDENGYRERAEEIEKMIFDDR